MYGGYQGGPGGPGGGYNGYGVVRTGGTGGTGGGAFDRNRVWVNPGYQTCSMLSRLFATPPAAVSRSAQPVKRPLAQVQRPLALTQPAKRAQKPLKRAQRPLARGQAGRTPRKGCPSRKAAQAQGPGCVGWAAESNKEHLRRHQGDPESKKCTRCIFLTRADKFRKEFPWLAPTPQFEGGPWRLGCTACQWLHRLRPQKRGPGTPTQCAVL